MKRIFTFLTLLIISNACIENDIPYPIQELYITDIEADGMVGDPLFDNVNYTASVTLDEATDIQNVEITNVVYSSEASLSQEIVGVHNLTSPLMVSLTNYQSYDWQIIASQPMERIFEVEGQNSATVFTLDSDNLSATTYVTTTTDLSNINIKNLKLGAADISSYYPAAEDITDFSSSYRTVTLTCHGRSEKWKLYVVPLDVNISLTQCEMWATKALLTASGDTSAEYGIRYKLATESSWHEIAADQITTSGGSFSAEISGLSPNSEYEFIAYAGSEMTPAYSATTEEALPITNGSFEEWFQSGDVWYPSLSSEALFWSSGNQGSAIVGGTNITTSSSDVPASSAGVLSARLESKYVLLKFAAGNIFTGRFVGVNGTNGTIALGRPFGSRPTALRLWVKYTCGVINHANTIPPGVDIVKDESYDTGSIYIALGDWTKEEYGYNSTGELKGTDESPVVVDTRSSATFFNANSAAVIGYGERYLTESLTEWQEITIPIEYSSTSRVPTHIIIVGSSSRYGDYFVGSSNSVMWLDDMELIYE